MSNQAYSQAEVLEPQVSFIFRKLILGNLLWKINSGKKVSGTCSLEINFGKLMLDLNDI